MISRLIKHVNYGLLNQQPMIPDVKVNSLNDDAIGETLYDKMTYAAENNSHERVNCYEKCNQSEPVELYTSEKYVYIENSNGENGFIISRENAQHVLTVIETKFGTEKLHNAKNRDKICDILHKKSELDITHEEWKAMGKNKPKLANW